MQTKSTSEKTSFKSLGVYGATVRRARKSSSLRTGWSTQHLCGRDLQERSKEHHRDFKKNHGDSHMLKHWSDAHPGSQRPKFNKYVVGSFKSCLDRQIAEAVMIQQRGNTLNSVGVYKRCKLTCLVQRRETIKKLHEKQQSMIKL